MGSSLISLEPTHILNAHYPGLGRAGASGFQVPGDLTTGSSYSSYLTGAPQSKILSHSSELFAKEATRFQPGACEMRRALQRCVQNECFVVLQMTEQGVKMEIATFLQMAHINLVAVKPLTGSPVKSRLATLYTLPPTINSNP